MLRKILMFIESLESFKDKETAALIIIQGILLPRVTDNNSHKTLTAKAFAVILVMKGVQ